MMRAFLPAALVSGMCAAAPVSAHPHVWVDASAELVFNGAGVVESIRHAWVFDEAFSSYLMLGLDLDGDGHYSREETAELATVNVTSLVDFHFFTSIAGAKTTDQIGDLYSEEFRAATDYYLEHDGLRTTLHFTLPLQQTVDPLAHDMVIVDIFDPEYFVAFSFAPNEPITLDGAPHGCSVTLDDPPQLDDTYASILSLIPQDGQVPQDLLSVTQQLANRARVRCV